MIVKFFVWPGCQKWHPFLKYYNQSLIYAPDHSGLGLLKKSKKMNHPLIIKNAETAIKYVLYICLLLALFNNIIRCTQ